MKLSSDISIIATLIAVLISTAVTLQTVFGLTRLAGIPSLFF
jgi:hypothetical protein